MCKKKIKCMNKIMDHSLPIVFNVFKVLTLNSFSGVRRVLLIRLISGFKNFLFSSCLTL